MSLSLIEGTHVAKKPKFDIPLNEQVLMSTIPYHSIEYEEQVSKMTVYYGMLIVYNAPISRKKKFNYNRYTSVNVKSINKIK